MEQTMNQATTEQNALEGLKNACEAVVEAIETYSKSDVELGGAINGLNSELAYFQKVRANTNE